MGYQKGFRGRGIGWPMGCREVLEGARIGVIADGVSCFPTKADCRRIRGVPVFDGYTRMVARLMGSLAVLRSVSIQRATGTSALAVYVRWRRKTART